jgi:hypothetical protein
MSVVYRRRRHPSAFEQGFSHLLTRNCGWGWMRGASIRRRAIRHFLKVAASLVFLKIFLPGEARTGTPVAVREGAKEWLLGRQVHFVHLTLVPEEAT